MRFRIETMACGGCVRSVTKAIQSVDPDARVEASPQTHEVQVASDLPREAFASALEEAGYPAVAA